jgi:hypothetical protein
MQHFVGAYAVIPSGGRRRLDDVEVGLIKVEFAACGEISLLAKSHDDEARRHRYVSLCTKKANYVFGRVLFCTAASDQK